MLEEEGDFIQVQPTAGSTRDQVYAALKDQIIKLKLKPGTVLSENEMAISFNVSRTPIRESFVRLSQEGLVQVYPQRGTVVALIDTELVEEARFMREQLECAIIKLACEHFPPQSLQDLTTNLLLQKDSIDREDVDRMFTLDQEFHRLLFAGVNKLNIWQTMKYLTVHLDRSRKLRMLDNHDWLLLYQQHGQIVEAIKENNDGLALTLMQQHLNLNISEQALLKQKYPDYFK